MDETQTYQALTDIYKRLFACYGPQHWWPAKEKFEIIVGAILTQSAAWTNVEKGINKLRSAGTLSAAGLRRLPENRLAVLIYSCGYFNAKAKKLRAFAEWLGNNYNDDLDALFTDDTISQREKLLSIHGIGPETADSIILYAAGKPIFVIDAYTRRIISRLGLAPDRDSYDAYQALFMNNLPHHTQMFNEYHALLVQLGKEVCRKTPVCEQCCLNVVCRTASNQEGLINGPHYGACTSVKVPIPP